MLGLHLLNIAAAAILSAGAPSFGHVKPSTSILYARCNTSDESQAIVCVFDAKFGGSERRSGFSDWESASQNEHDHENDTRGKFYFKKTQSDDAKDDASDFEGEEYEGIAEKLKKWILTHPKEPANLLACLAAGSLAAAIQLIVGPVAAGGAFAVLQSAAMGGYGATIVNLIAATGAVTDTCSIAAASFLRAMRHEEPEGTEGGQPPNTEHVLSSCWSQCYVNLVNDSDEIYKSRPSKILCIDPAFYALTSL